MASLQSGQLVWLRTATGNRLFCQVTEATLERGERFPHRIQISNLSIPLINRLPDGAVVIHRQPIDVTERADELAAGPVFAVLTAMRKRRFAGNRADLWALSETVTRFGGFLYVLPAEQVTDTAQWSGYVRVGPKDWRLLPCPRPEAIYNRIPFRALERTQEVAVARHRIDAFGIPMFNPEYFNKAQIYQVIAESAAAGYLPATQLSFDEQHLTQMMRTHRSVYLKPCGGSIGHGMIRVESMPGGYLATSLKKGDHVRAECDTLGDVWHFVRHERVPGRYVIQAAKPLLTWEGRPADFRVLLQKQSGTWHVVGRGVRVAGTGSITTHVPNGGSIVSADDVLAKAFGSRASDIDAALHTAVLRCADAIDGFYRGQLGEMSMDMGVEPNGRIWFLEANSKPMKFDEPAIRRASLEGVVRYLEELRTRD